MPTTVEDIVARNRSGSWDAEAFLQKVLDVVPDLIYVFNHETMSNEYSNRSLGEMLGYSSDEVQAMGAAMMPTLLHPDDAARVYENFELIKSLRNDDVARIEYRARHKDGRWVWLLSTDAVFSRDALGHVTRHLGSAVDITMQKEAAARARYAEKEAVATSDELRGFAYSMSHDMKAPSNTLDLALSELRQSLLGRIDDADADLLDMAQTTVKRMGQLIEDVLGYTRVIGQEIVFENVALDDLVGEVVESLRADLSSARARVDLEDLPVVRGSRMQLTILLQNLISNACKFRNSGVAPIIRISGAVDKACGRVSLTVSDNGIGIDKEHHEEVFTIFKRLHGASQYEGQGLGLAICRRIAANHGGDISLASGLGNGAAFTVSLALA